MTRNRRLTTLVTDLSLDHETWLGEIKRFLSICPSGDGESVRERKSPCNRCLDETPGRLVSRSAFKIGAGYRITIPIGAFISWNGDRIEGKGIAPDGPVDWSYEDVLQGIDNQLNRAIQAAGSGSF